MTRVPGTPPVASPAGDSRREAAAGVWERLAPAYDGWMRVYDRLMLGDGRSWVASRARGRVLEVAAGTGLNLPSYPPGLPVAALDASAAMLWLARARASGRNPAAVLLRGSAQALPFADGSFDTIACTLGLCCVPDPAGAVLEMRRVLRGGGRLLLLDHVVSSSRVVRAAQRAADGVMWRRCGDRQTHRSLPLVEAAGFVIEAAERRRAGLIERVAAIKPSRPPS